MSARLILKYTYIFTTMTIRVSSRIFLLEGERIDHVKHTAPGGARPGN